MTDIFTPREPNAVDISMIKLNVSSNRMISNDSFYREENEIKF